MRKKEISPDETKLAELILYIAQKCASDDTFGATKLNKLLFHADFLAYGEFGEPITGVEYMKLEKGPAPRPLVPVREKMKASGDLAVIPIPYYDMPRPQERPIALRDADLSSFKPEEIALVDAIIQQFWGKSAAEITKMTHRYRGWRIAKKIRDTIPYTAVFLSDEPLTEYELQHAKELIEEHGWDV